jgi:hypothetical protein
MVDKDRWKLPRSPIAMAVKYLVLLRIARCDKAIDALADYINGMSPSEISAKYGISKDGVRGFWSRVLTKCGSAQKAKALIRCATPIILSLKPVVEKNGNTYRCLLCGETFVNGGDAQTAISVHVNTYHSDYIERATVHVISRMRDRVLNNNHASKNELKGIG